MTAIETAELRRAVLGIEAWIMGLPASSWRESFVTARRELEDELAVFEGGE
jgi:hypothetical protein